MRESYIIILVALFITGVAYAQEAWYEAAEASGADVAAGRNIPAHRDTAEGVSSPDMVKADLERNIEVLDNITGDRLAADTISKVSAASVADTSVNGGAVSEPSAPALIGRESSAGLATLGPSKISD